LGFRRASEEPVRYEEGTGCEKCVHCDHQLVHILQRISSADTIEKVKWANYAKYAEGNRENTQDREDEAFQIPRLAAAGAVEFGHGAFHFLASGVGGGTDSLNAEAEIVRVRSAHDGFFE
jgi:hypothetical protein